MNVSKLIKGMNKDIPFSEQGNGIYSYALNTILGTERGDGGSLSNEESNTIAASLKEGYLPIGKIYMTKSKVAIFSVSKDNKISEIGILYSNGSYKEFVNDKNSLSHQKLNFSINNQINGVYRLVGGCDETIYWTDGGKPRQFNFNSPRDYQNQNGLWVASKFNLQKTYEKIPQYKKIEVLESGGNTESGSYSFAIQYLDQSLNPTEFMADSAPVRIFNDITSKEFAEVKGSINSDINYINFPKTSKAIKLSLSNLDTNYLYYRVAIIIANNGSGTINEILYSDNIPTDKDTFIFTGDNFSSKGTIEDIQSFTRVFEKVGYMEQIDNKLLLASIEESDASLCQLQKYASKIKVDCVTKEIVLNDINHENNPKNPSHCFNNGIGYMPGEIYSTAIAYIFEDNTISPAFHIPGLSSKDKDVTFTEGDNVYPMNTDNNISTVYSNNNSSCSSNNYWGVDYNGEPLEGKPVRHHRFPLRSEIGLPLVTTEYGEENTTKSYLLNYGLKGKLKLPVPCPIDNPNCGTDKTSSFSIRLEYRVNGEYFFVTETIDPNTYADFITNEVDIDIVFNTRYHNTNNFTSIKMSVTDANNIYQDVDTFDFSNYYNGAVQKIINSDQITSTVQGKVVKSKILGMKFSNIEKPPIELTGKEVIGYYILRNERTEFDKTILDSAVLFPSIENTKYVSHGILQPDTNNISKTAYGLLHLENKFNGKEYLTYDQMIQEGNFEVIDKKLGKVNYDDVYDGSSYNSKSHKDGNDDGQEVDGDPTSRGYDGWSFNLISRDNIVSFKPGSNFKLEAKDFKDRFYLEALGSKSIDDYKKEYYNISADNSIGVVQTKEENKIKGNLPYVILKRSNLDSYSNFRYLPYYKETVNPVYFNDNRESEVSIFNGDAYVSPIRYNSTVYWDNRVADRAGKKSILKVILGAVALIAGAILTATGIAASAGALVIGTGISIIGAGALYASSGIKMENFNKAYSEEYEKGLRQTALDNWTDMFYNYKSNIPFGYTGNGRTGGSGPSDDTIQWATDCITDLWLETTVNTNLRNSFAKEESPTFLPSPWRVESGNDSKIGTWEFFGKYYTNSNSQRYPISSLEQHVCRKLLTFDESRDDNRYYLGAPLGEYYQINPDYKIKGFIKPIFHLPAEYDCCSDCLEKYPHRVFYSEVSYQEETTDNYRIFLPNNYRDLDGETGVITNMFKLGQDLFIHTQEALWQIPRNYQERVTDQVVSFIGTGDFFSVPPRKVLDDDTGNSGGCSHNWGTIKTPAGVYFPSVNQDTIYRFDGRQLTSISDIGMEHWFNNNMKIQADANYYDNHLEEYPFMNNPSNPFGSGFIVAFDSANNRVVFTKKDIVIKNLPTSDFKLSTFEGDLYIFKDYSQILSREAIEGWSVDKIVGDEILFERIGYEPVEDTRYLKGQPYTTTTYELNYKTKRVKGEKMEYLEKVNHSWTISFSLELNAWLSFHSYLPNFYMQTANDFYSCIDSNIWKHNVLGNYGNFYGKANPHIIEYSVNSQPLQTKIVESIALLTEARKYDSDLNEYVDIPNVTYNKAIFYNTRQCSGLQNLIVKDPSIDYLQQQVVNSSLNNISIDRTERDWSINQLRDLRVDYTKPLFISNIESLQQNYFTDKILNEATIDYQKDWTQQESFRDKFLVVRLIFDNFDDVKLLLNYSVEDERPTFK